MTAIEFDAGLAGRAAANLHRHANVRAIEGDGAIVAFEPADVIYVNAGATRPADAWLDRLRDGGRLVLPLTTDEGFRAANAGPIERRGAVFVITRHGSDFGARWVSAVAIFPGEGMRDEASERALTAALAKGEWKRVTRLYRNGNVAEERCWLRAPDWCLAYE